MSLPLPQGGEDIFLNVGQLAGGFEELTSLEYRPLHQI